MRPLNREEETAVTAIKFMIVDDFSKWRVWLRSLLELIPGFEVIGEAENGLEAIEKAAQLRPDIVLLDIGMPVLHGIDAAPQIRRASPQSTIIFVTQESDSEVRTAALATGAAAYLLKSTITCDLQRTIFALAPFRRLCPESVAFQPSERLP